MALRLPVLTQSGRELVVLDVLETNSVISIYDTVAHWLLPPHCFFVLIHDQLILFEGEATLASYNVGAGDTLTVVVLDESHRVWRKREETFRSLDGLVDCARGVAGALLRRPEETPAEHAARFTRLRQRLVWMFYRLGGGGVEEAVRVAEAQINALFSRDLGIPFRQQVEHVRERTMAQLAAAAEEPLERRVERVTFLAMTVDLLLQDMLVLTRRVEQSSGTPDSDSESEPDFLELRRTNFYAEWLSCLMENLPAFEMDWNDVATCEVLDNMTSRSYIEVPSSRSYIKVPKQEKSQSSSGNGDPVVMSCEEAASTLLGRSTPAPGTEPEPFHCALPPEPVEAGWQKLEDPDKKYKFVIFKERNTNRSTADMMSPAAKTTRMLIEERLAWPSPLDPLYSAVQFVRGYRLADFLPDNGADDKKTAHAKKHVEVHVRAQTGSRPLDRETVKELDAQLNALIVDIVGGRGGARLRKPSLNMVNEDSYLSASEDETDEGQTTPDTCCEPSSGSDSWGAPDSQFRGPPSKECLQDNSESGVNAQTASHSQQKAPLHLTFEASSQSSGDRCKLVGEPEATMPGTADRAPGTPESLFFENVEQEQLDWFGGAEDIEEDREVPATPESVFFDDGAHEQVDCSGGADDREENCERLQCWPRTPDPLD